MDIKNVLRDQTSVYFGTEFQNFSKDFSWTNIKLKVKPVWQFFVMKF